MSRRKLAVRRASEALERQLSREGFTGSVSFHFLRGQVRKTSVDEVITPKELDREREPSVDSEPTE